MLISIVIPVYDSAVLQELSERIDRVFAKLPEEYEIIFIDDSSPNLDVWPSLVDIAGKNSHIRALQLTRNFGQHAATLCGLVECRGDFVITMDDDLQHCPEDIPKFLELRDYDVVIAQFKNKQHGTFKRITSLFLTIHPWSFGWSGTSASYSLVLVFSSHCILCTGNWSTESGYKDGPLFSLRFCSSAGYFCLG